MVLVEVVGMDYVIQDHRITGSKNAGSNQSPPMWSSYKICFLARIVVHASLKTLAWALDSDPGSSVGLPGTVLSPDGLSTTTISSSLYKTLSSVRP